jgi:putative glutamine amidotransferase
MPPTNQERFRRILYSLLGSLLILLVLTGCRNTEQVPADRDPVIIAISKAVPAETYRFYGKWLQYGDSSVAWHDLYHLELDSALALLNQCDGLLLTGGTDIYPGRYGREQDTARCWKPDFKRDTLESALIRAAMDLGMPIMGICRGLQMINVELGGTLFIDLPSDLDTLVAHQSNLKYETMHPIEVDHPSLLHTISNETKGMANSNHHQGIRILASDLTGIARSQDGLIEAIQRRDSLQPFLFGVQWHPERMDYSNPMSGTIAKRFLREAQIYSNQKNK